MSAQTRIPRRLLVLALAVAGVPLAQAEPVETSLPSVLELLAIVPGPTYDPFDNPLPRRRPGHPAQVPQEFEVINPDAVPPAPIDQVGDFMPVPDRWRIMESLGADYPWYDPYNQNQWKGDIPTKVVDGDKKRFLTILAISDTVLEPRGIPTPVAPQSSPEPGANDVLGDTDQLIFSQTLIASVDYYQGDTTFKPPDWEWKATLAFNYNRVDTDEERALNIDPSRGTNRDDGFVGVQELFYLKDYNVASVRYDFDEFRIGIQPFSTDFRGFLFQDNQLGIRFFGNRDNNRWQYNAGVVPPHGEGPNSGLNDITEAAAQRRRVRRQPLPAGLAGHGFISQAHRRLQPQSRLPSFYDSNGFIQRPAAVGLESPREYDVTYVGYNGDGHFGRVEPHDIGLLRVRRPDTRRVRRRDGTDIRAGFFAAEASMDFDWVRIARLGALRQRRRGPVRRSFHRLTTRSSRIRSSPAPIPATGSGRTCRLIGGGGVALSTRNGLLANLRSSKEQGQSNFDNPGLRLIGLGADFDSDPHVAPVGEHQPAVVRPDRGAGDAARGSAHRSRHRHRPVPGLHLAAPVHPEHRVARLRARHCCRARA